MTQTIKQLLAVTISKLQTASSSPALDAEILLAHVLKKPREFLFAHPEFTPSIKTATKFNHLIARRLLSEPIAYLIKNKEFCGLNFFVDKRVLVPRPETELLVEKTVEIIKEQGLRIKEQKNILIDVGTGSGCIPITILKTLQRKLSVVATDISPTALTVARRNARAHHVKIKFPRGNLLTPIVKILTPNTSHLTPSSLVITANLPYLPAEVCHRQTKVGGWKEWKNNCSMNSAGLKFEPPQALYTGKYGLELYEKLFRQIHSPSFINHYSSIILLAEFDPRQTKLLRALIKRTLPHARVQIKKDLAGLDRVAIIKVE